MLKIRVLRIIFSSASILATIINIEIAKIIVIFLALSNKNLKSGFFFTNIIYITILTLYLNIFCFYFIFLKSNVLILMTEKKFF